MKKKILSLILCGAMVFSLAACGKTKKPSSGGNGGAQASGVTLRLLGYSTQCCDIT